MTETSRRTFLKAAATVAAANLASSAHLSARPLKQPLGLQLYSVRQMLPNDFDGTLAKLSSMGYKVVEAAGYYDRTPADFKKAMDAAGLRCVSTHHALNPLETQLDQWLDYGHAIGLEYFICSSSGGMHRDKGASGPPTLDDWRWIADEFNRIGEKAKAAGMQFGVHNHTPEFATIDGVLVYDELLKRTDPNLVIFEMDAGWVAASGHEPADYLKKSPQRFPLIHVKDFVKGEDGKEKPTLLGKGSPDFASVMRVATGLKYYFIEQEAYEMEPFEELRLNGEYMRHLNV